MNQIHVNLNSIGADVSINASPYVKRKPSVRSTAATVPFDRSNHGCDFQCSGPISALRTTKMVSRYVMHIIMMQVDWQFGVGVHAIQPTPVAEAFIVLAAAVVNVVVRNVSVGPTVRARIPANPTAV
eukprot:SAG31_NODE_3096_length_4680_cov_1.703995_1_plen_127_part_00